MLADGFVVVIPVRIAEVEEIIVFTLQGEDGKADSDILTASYIAGVDKIYLVGGAQAVAATAFGTELIPKADKIVGPGNMYVAEAKRALYGIIDIDMIAGPSEILIIADKNAKPAYIINHPIVADPVGAGASQYRRRSFPFACESPRIL